MNVFKKDGFDCIGWSVWKHGPVPPYAQFAIQDPLPVSFDTANISAEGSFRAETYEIDQVFHIYPNQRSPKKSFVWKVNPDTQNLTPLDIKPYCNIGWML